PTEGFSHRGANGIGSWHHNAERSPGFECLERFIPPVVEHRATRSIERTGLALAPAAAIQQPGELAICRDLVGNQDDVEGSAYRFGSRDIAPESGAALAPGKEGVVAEKCCVTSCRRIDQWVGSLLKLNLVFSPVCQFAITVLGISEPAWF